MPYYHCRKCHHEFEDVKNMKVKCDWCGADSPRILEEQTPLEKMCSPKGIKKLMNILLRNHNGNLRKR